MRGYHLTQREVLDLPVTLFWLMLKNLDRLNAQDDIRQLRLLASAQSGQAAKETQQSLVAEIGDIVKRAPVFERAKLKGMMKRIKKEDALRQKKSEVTDSGEQG